MSLDIRIIVPGLALQLPDPLAAALGGSETAGLELARAFVKRGHRVSCFCNVPQATAWEGVILIPEPQAGSACMMVPSDIVIAQRQPQYFGMRMASKLNLLWAHDLLMGRRKGDVLAAMHAIDRLVMVSEYQKRQWLEVLGEDVAESSFFVSSNAIDADRIKRAIEGVEARDPTHFVYTTRPERGLDVLLRHIWPKVRERLPEATLSVAAYDVPNPAMDGFYQWCGSHHGRDGITFLGALPKDDLYRLYASAGAWVYPTPGQLDPRFAETFCISALEAMACGAEGITTDRGALPGTIGPYGNCLHLEDGQTGADIAEAFAAQMVRSAEDPIGPAIRERAREHAAVFSWDGVAAGIEQLFDEVMATTNDDFYRLAAHFYRRQDIEGVTHVVQRAEATGSMTPPLRKLWGTIEKLYAHRKSPKLLAAHYANREGPKNGKVTEGLLMAPPERFLEQPFVRFNQLRELIGQKLARRDPPVTDLGTFDARILDFGCAQGECSIVLANSFPYGAVVGIDASPDEITRANALAAKHLREERRLRFATGSETDLSEAEKGAPYDVLVCAEVLEHVYDPVDLLQRLERLVRPGGVVVLTMPYGPWELQQQLSSGAQPGDFRQHLREWNAFDLHEVFAAKPGLTVDQVPFQLCPITAEPLGVTMVSYYADQQPLGRLDWKRKLVRQRPRQTLSACMMVGGAKAQGTLHWCLEPLSHIADEIVVADTGMSDEARRILADYGAALFPAPSPLDPKVGFFTPRNMGLDRCSMDWVLMVDADELLLSPATLTRYLRESMFHTFSIPQHHLAVDAAWKPDLPGRLFRRRAEEKTGKPMRFIGFLHEHAELGVNEGTGRTLVLPDVQLAHVGYVNHAARVGRYERNLPLLQADVMANPDRKLTLLVVMRDTNIRAKDILAGAGVDLNQPGCAHAVPETVRLLQDTVRIFSDVYLDDDGMMGMEAEGHYHDACRMLGTGVLAEIRITMARDGIGAAGPEARFFADPSHVRKRTEARLRGLDKVFAGPWW